jgi:hypothetical protein
MESTRTISVLLGCTVLSVLPTAAETPEQPQTQRAKYTFNSRIYKNDPPNESKSWDEWKEVLRNAMSEQFLDTLTSSGSIFTDGTSPSKLSCSAMFWLSSRDGVMYQNLRVEKRTMRSLSFHGSMVEAAREREAVRGLDDLAIVTIWSLPSKLVKFPSNSTVPYAKCVADFSGESGVTKLTVTPSDEGPPEAKRIIVVPQSFGAKRAMPVDVVAPGTFSK